MTPWTFPDFLLHIHLDTIQLKLDAMRSDIVDKTFSQQQKKILALRFPIVGTPIKHDMDKNDRDKIIPLTSSSLNTTGRKPQEEENHGYSTRVCHDCK